MSRTKRNKKIFIYFSYTEKCQLSKLIKIMGGLDNIINQIKYNLTTKSTIYTYDHLWYISISNIVITYLENKPLKRREAPDSSFALVRAHQ